MPCFSVTALCWSALEKCGCNEMAMSLKSRGSAERLQRRNPVFPDRCVDSSSSARQLDGLALRRRVVALRVDRSASSRRRFVPRLRSSCALKPR